VNGPAFSAYLGSTQSISLSTATKAVFNTERFDTNSCFNNTGSTVGGIPAYAFLPNVAGYYQTTVSIFCDYSVSQFSSAEVYIYKNGVSISRTTASSMTWYGNMIAADVIYLNGSTDYIEAYALIAGGAGPQLLGNFPNRSTFSAAMVRAA
jgi:hypothetical protein